MLTTTCPLLVCGLTETRSFCAIPTSRQGPTCAKPPQECAVKGKLAPAETMRASKKAKTSSQKDVHNIQASLFAEHWTLKNSTPPAWLLQKHCWLFAKPSPTLLPQPKAALHASFQHMYVQNTSSLKKHGRNFPGTKSFSFYSYGSGPSTCSSRLHKSEGSEVKPNFRDTKSQAVISSLVAWATNKQGQGPFTAINDHTRSHVTAAVWARVAHVCTRAKAAK